MPEETQKQKEDGDLSYFGTGDTYTVDDDNTEAGIYISADDKAAKVDINVRQYIYRPMMEIIPVQWKCMRNLRAEKGIKSKGFART